MPILALPSRVTLRKQPTSLKFTFLDLEMGTPQGYKDEKAIDQKPLAALGMWVGS